jgi:hypothetical protein
MREAVKVSPASPVLLDRFLNDAIEVDVDCVSDGEQVLIGGVMEHVEQAGIHSGDSACSLPPYSLAESTVAEIKRQTVRLAHGLGVVGLMNVQFAVQRHKVDGRMLDRIFVLEVNGIAMGFAIFRKDIFKQVSKPWFDTASTHTQDIFFCQKAKAEAGARFAVHCGVLVGHLDVNSGEVI